MLRAAFEQFEVFVAGHTRDVKPIGKSSARFEACLHRNHAAGVSTCDVASTLSFAVAIFL